MQSDVSIVVINYSNDRYLNVSLDAVEHMDGVKEVIVVDDASTDGSLEILGRRSNITLIRNERNLGPVASRNVGARRARGAYLLFLDADARLSPDYAAQLAAFLESRSEVGVVTGKVLGDDGKRMWFNFGNDPAPLRDWMQNAIDAAMLKFWHNAAACSILRWLGRPFTLNFVPDTVRRVDWVVEMAFMTRRDLFEKLGGFDEKFYMFFEGPDYCRRVRDAGHDVYYFPNVTCEHLGGHSHSETRGRFFQESRDYYYKKYANKKYARE